MLKDSGQNNHLFDSAGQIYQQNHIAHWDAIARKRDKWNGWGGTYHHRLEEVYRFLVSPGLRVLEVGCGFGELLAALQPARGVGLDFSAEMIKRARAKYTGLEFVQADVHDLSSLEGLFDIIVFSDTVNDLWDVQRAFGEIKRLCLPCTRILINFYSGLWQLPLAIAQWLNLAGPVLTQN